jgi:hypothetical protein
MWQWAAMIKDGCWLAFAAAAAAACDCMLWIYQLLCLVLRVGMSHITEEQTEPIADGS